MATITRELTLLDISCDACGLVFAVPQEWLRARQRDAKGFWCPNGHSLSYRKSEADKLRERVAQLEAQKTHLADQRDAAQRRAEAALRSAAAVRGENTKLRKRVANGVCPCCHRSFVNVARHMSSKHPDFAGGGGS